MGGGQTSWERGGSGPTKAKRQKLAHRVWETVSVWGVGVSDEAGIREKPECQDPELRFCPGGDGTSLKAFKRC